MSPKVAGDVASLTDPALDRILDFAGEVGLVVLIHNDIDVPFAKEDAQPVYLDQMKDAAAATPEDDDHLGAHRPRARRPPGARLGVGARRPSGARATCRSWRRMLADPALPHVHFDLSWDEVAKYVVATPETLRTARRT